MDNARIIANLNLALGIIGAIPEERVDLEAFKRECAQGCGTHACLAGWLAQDPRIRDQGMWLVPRPDGRDFGHGWIVAPTPHAQPAMKLFSYDFSWLDELFGDDAFDRLFEARGDSVFDGDVDDGTTSDKALAIHRLKAQLKRIEAVSA